MFLAACADRKYRVKTHRNDRSRTCDAVELRTDVARIGPDAAARVLVLISGTHGVEGFCGSACRTAAVSLSLFDDLPSQTAVILIHAINPFGFAFLRRVTEANVDLNRNCVDEFEGEALKKFQSRLCGPGQRSESRDMVSGKTTRRFWCVLSLSLRWRQHNFHSR
jgi:hypothetical protein